MKRLPLLLALLISCSSFGQGVDRTVTLLDSFLSIDKLSAHSSSFELFLKKLEKKKSRSKDEKEFAEFLFIKTHQQYLKRYEAYSTISNVFDNGTYDCLTGTILYTILLDHFEISHQVIETNYHIFILAETEQEKVLLEATDPLNGFVTNHKEIESRIKAYRENLIPGSDSKKPYHQFSFELFRSVSLKELKGLLYYNKAVNAFNHQNLQESVQNLKMANVFYSSPRIDEFSEILFTSSYR